MTAHPTLIAASFLALGVASAAVVQEKTLRLLTWTSEGATPMLNAVSLFLMLASALLALSLLRGSKAFASQSAS